MVAATGRLIGREEELGAVVGLLDEPGEAPDVAVLAGEAGIGKTTVWLAACEEASARGYRVLSTRPSDGEVGWSYAGLADLLGDAADDVLPHLPGVQQRALEAALLLGEPQHDIDERTVAAATLSALRQLAGERPVLVAVDDVQWLDAATLAVLRFVLARVAGDRVAALLSVRGTAPAWVRRAVPEPRLRAVDVVGLSLGATYELLRTRLAANLARPTLIKLWTTSGGNPFFAIELGSALQRRGGTLAAGEELPIPTELDALLRERLEALDDSALAVAEIVAMAAEPTVELVERVVGQLDCGLASARAADILAVDGDRVRFSHPLLAAAVVARQSQTRRGALHARLADVAQTAEQRARHLAFATREPDARIAATLEEAAFTLQARGAPAAAAELAERALALTPASDRLDAQRRLLFAAKQTFVAGDVGRARALLDRALAGAAPGVERAVVLTDLAHVIRDGADDDTAAEALYREALAEPVADDAVEARVHIDLAEVLARTAGIKSAVEHAALAVAAAHRSGDVALECRARAILATMRFRAGDGLDRAEFEQAVALECTLPEWPIPLGPTEYLASQLVWTGELAAARTITLELRELRRTLADAGGEAWELRTLSLVEWRVGNWPAAERLAAESAALMEQAGVTRRLHVVLGLFVAAHLGRADEVRREARARIASGLTELALAFHEWVLGFVELSLDDARAAIGLLRSSYEHCNALVLDPGMRLELGDLLEALVATGELDEAEQVLETWEPRAAKLDRAWALAILARGRGLVLAARGDQDGASASFEGALAEHARDADPFQHARTLLALGRTQRRAKQRADARATLTDALNRFDRLGAPLWAEQTRAELARIGGRTPSGDELTEAERRIAILVAEGKTNREVAAALFVTEHAVEKALTRVYRKLGLRSRTELAARLTTSEPS
jgi:DNA-binding CsgD family transcriptional regulator